MVLKRVLTFFLFLASFGLFAQSSTSPMGANINAHGHQIHPVAVSGPTYCLSSTESNLNIHPVFPNCCLGDFYVRIGLELDRNTQVPTEDWTVEVFFDFQLNGVDQWSSSLSLSSVDGVVADTRFVDTWISSSDNYTIEITNVDFPIGNNQILDDICLKLNHFQRRNDDFTPDVSLSPNFNIGSRTLSWQPIDPSVFIVDGYDVEWVCRDRDTDNEGVLLTLQEAFDGKLAVDTSIPDIESMDPARVTTKGTSYTFTQSFTQGFLWTRVRYNGFTATASDHITYGDWHYLPAVPINNETGMPWLSGMNWQQTVTYAEEAKNKKVVQYYDPTLRPIQTLTNLNSQESLLITEHFYDYEGRKVIDFLPYATPNPSQLMSYLPRNTFPKSDYDNGDEANPALTAATSNTENYFSAGSYYHASDPGIPMSEGFPYTQVEYKSDGTNRVTRQSGVGAAYAIDGSHTTDYFYGSASREELRRLFGDTFGSSEYYMKQVIKDPNGQFSVSYVDPLGRTIATALTGAAPANLKALESNVGSENITMKLDEKFEQEGNKRTLTHKILNVVSTDYNFNYDLKSRSVDLGGECKTCTYTTSITVEPPKVEEETDISKYSFGTLSTIGCLDDPLGLLGSGGVNLPESFTEVGEYTVHANIEANIPTYEEALAEVETWTDVKIKLSHIEEANPVYEEDCEINVNILDITSGENDDLLDEIYESSCDNIKYRIIQDLITPCTAGDALGCGWTPYSATNSYTDDDMQVLAEAFDYSLVDGQEDVSVPEGITQAMVLDIVGHPAYCEYEFCQNYKESALLDTKLMAYTAWSTDIPTIIYENDPVFNTGGFFERYKFDLDIRFNNYTVVVSDGQGSSDPSDDVQGSILDLIDENNVDLQVNVSGVFQKVDNTAGPYYHAFYWDIYEAQAENPNVDILRLVAERKVRLFSSFYSDIKNQFLLKYASDGFDENGISGFSENQNTFCESLKIRLESIANQPATEVGVDAENTVFGVFDDNISDTELDMMVGRFQLKCPALSTQDAANIRTHLQDYYDNHYDEKNILRVLYSDDLSTTPLTAINNILIANGCTSLDDPDDGYLVAGPCDLFGNIQDHSARKPWVEIQKTLCPSPVPLAFSIDLGAQCANPYYQDIDQRAAEYKAQCMVEMQAYRDHVVEAEQREYLETKITDYLNKYEQNCLDHLVSSLSYEYAPSEYHYTLYYYDRAGNLVQTVPPEGVHTDNSGLHDLVTRYTYNAYNQLVSQSSPDGGVTKFYYNSAGQLRLSQNAEQRKHDMFSYTNYDLQNRITEAGEIAVDPELIPGMLADVDQFRGTHSELDDFVSDDPNTPDPIAYQYTVTDRFLTTYSDPYPSASFEQTYLRNRVSYTEAEQIVDETPYTVTTYYSYDPHGNVKSLVQVLPDVDEKRIDYVYDLISDNVLQVLYQPGQPDQFIHKYAYDADNRILKAETSHDGINWDQDATYEYYPHGPLKRTELGHFELQGMDYTYTLQGWLKSINAPWEGDPGGDVGTFFGKDAFSMSLGYYDGDYTSISAVIPDFNERDALWTRHQEQYPTAGSEAPGLYNGNIAWMNTHLSELGKAEDTPEAGMQGKLYQYDQLNRLLDAKALNTYSTGYTARAPSEAFDSDYTYDQNGNLMTLNRLDNQAASSFSGVYTYLPGTNKLLSTSADDAANLDFSVWEAEANATAVSDYRESVPPLSEIPETRAFDGILDPEQDHKIVASSYVDFEPGFIFDPAAGVLDVVISDDINELPHLDELPPSSPGGYDVHRTVSYDQGVTSGSDYVAVANSRITLRPGFNFSAATGHMDAYLSNATVTGDPTADLDLYQYDAIGNLVADQKEGTSIEWNASGKVEQVLQANGDKVRFLYDAAGNRVAKIQTVSGVTTTSAYARDASGNTMAVYKDQVLAEMSIYGSRRLGMYKGGSTASKRTLGNKTYELSNHLGNVMAVITDDYFITDGNEKEAVVINSTDYYPFGLEQPGVRAGNLTASNTNYRYGFNGKEKDTNGEWGSQAHYDYGFRIYNPQIGKFLSVDPLTGSYPMLTPYQFASNRPIDGIDLDGLEYLRYSVLSFENWTTQFTLSNKNTYTQQTIRAGIDGSKLREIYPDLSFGLSMSGIYLSKNSTEPNFDQITINHKLKTEIFYASSGYKIVNGKRVFSDATVWKSYKNKKFAIFDKQTKFGGRGINIVLESMFQFFDYYLDYKKYAAIEELREFTDVEINALAKTYALVENAYHQDLIPSQILNDKEKMVGLYNFILKGDKPRNSDVEKLGNFLFDNESTLINDNKVDQKKHPLKNTRGFWKRNYKTAEALKNDS
ncbi:MAG: hypothetical protein JXR03_04925 [Cyclobacteriaceae bacterium]